LFKWHKHQPAILADEMGLGKTVQVISFIAVTYERYKVAPILIIAPNSTLGNWSAEFKKWVPQLVIVAYSGSFECRKVVSDYQMFRTKAQGKKELKCHAVLTSFDSIRNDRNLFKSIEWEVVVVDEGHRLKNDESKLSETMKELKVKHKILLTGTPLQNNLKELFNLMNFLDPDSFSDAKALYDKYGKEGLSQEKVLELHSVFYFF
jgi:chromodomain-helicase-DNA-binding protein 4